MFHPKQLLALVIGKSTDEQAAETFLVNSGAQFQVRVHEGWCIYDAQNHTLVDPARGNAVVPTRIEDIVSIKFGDRIMNIDGVDAEAAGRDERNRRTDNTGERGQVKDPATDGRLKQNNPEAGKAGGEARADQMAARGETTPTGGEVGGGDRGRTPAGGGLRIDGESNR